MEKCRRPRVAGAAELDELKCRAIALAPGVARPVRDVSWCSCSTASARRPDLRSCACDRADGSRPPSACGGATEAAIVCRRAFADLGERRLIGDRGLLVVIMRLHPSLIGASYYPTFV